jgi:ABC-type sulfate transport system permease component
LPGRPLSRPAQPVGAFFSGYGINMTNNVLAIVVTLAFVSATCTVKQVEEAIKSLDPKLELVCRSLGASSTFTFFNVTLPNIWHSVVSGNHHSTIVI